MSNSQDTKVDPAQAWQSVIDQLHTSMSPGRFDDYVGSTRFLGYENGVMTIAAISAYACGWLEDRVYALAKHHLAGFVNHAVDVKFVVDDQMATDADEDLDDKKPTGNITIEVVDATAYQSEVRPDRVVVLDGYFLRLLEHGDIDPKGLSLYLGYRQAVYAEWNTGGKQARNVIKNIPNYEAMKFSMMGRASYFREISNKDELCGGLVERLQGERDFTATAGRRQEANSNRYRVLMFPHLSRCDLAALEVLIADVVDKNPIKTDALPALTGFLNRLAIEGDPAGYLAVETKKPASHRSILGIVRSVVGWEGDLPEDLIAASEKVLDSIITAFGKVFITHYFLQVVVPTLKLTHAQAWAIIALRDRCWFDYESKTQKPFAIVSGGADTLAQWVGVTNEAMRLWMLSLEFSAFVRLADTSKLVSEFGWSKNDTIFLVSLQEPMLQKVRLGSPKSETRSSKKCDSVLQKVRLELAKSETRLNNLIKPLLSSNKSIKTTTSDENFENFETTPEMQKPVVVVDEWDLSSLFRANGVSKKKQKQLLDAGATGPAFASWLLYGYTPAGKGLTDLVGNAIQSTLASSDAGAGGVCDLLAGYGPEKLASLLADSIRGAMVSSNSFLSAFGHLSVAQKQELLMRIGANQVDVQERIPVYEKQLPQESLPTSGRSTEELRELLRSRARDSRTRKES